LILGGERVTDENAPITFIEPDHPLLNTPNKMGQDDFKDWIQERGLYYPREWDPQFHALLPIKRSGRESAQGWLAGRRLRQRPLHLHQHGLVPRVARGIPGAYKMLANMISYGR
jgi:hypothetical protein